MSDPLTPRPGRARLWAEFAAFYILAPLGMALLLPPALMFPMLFAMTGLGLALLNVTEGFRWAELRQGIDAIDWRAVGAFAAVTLAVCLGVILSNEPGVLFFMLRERPLLLPVIIALYPVVSALPQELVYRPLFFRRYGALLPGLKPALLLNAALFSLAHLMYWNWVAAVMSFFGGLAFGWSYEARRNFPQAVVLHAVAGWIIFTLGLGVHFYSGNVQRPF
ncbi:CPBP family intramembrane glutamic endopeptidase [Actibacterium sp. MT2.3-13A]|uniref:CPBP family intramembrane glutamic endopeptidase n=1 Tax=Actibacterium sp. MT2.3-13A TaxID=2828332 RepID=UPI001BA80985|nr:CPBP family intramembrane glutamic endopeptidase [Actibacterium sp. MT2.3-13A]